VRNQTLTIKAADGTILQQQGPATREQLKLEEIKAAHSSLPVQRRAFTNTTALITRAFSEQSSKYIAPGLWKVVAPLRNRWRGFSSQSGAQRLAQD